MGGTVVEDSSLQVCIPRMSRDKEITLSSALFYHLMSIESEKFNCDHCQVSSSIFPANIIHNFPEVLTLVLKRVEFDKVEKRAHMNHTKVKFDEDINLNYCNASDLYGRNIIYTSFGIACRQGDSQDTGHFYAGIPHSSGVTILNDHNISHYDQSSASSGIIKADVLIIMLRRRYEQKSTGYSSEDCWNVEASDEKILDEFLNSDSSICVVNGINIDRWRTLLPDEWVHSEIIDASFTLLANKYSNVIALPFTTIQPTAAEGDGC